MRPYEEMTDERRCELGCGLHYKSREWDEIFNAGGWDGAWPEIDRHGNLTGRIIGNEDGYLNVNDEVMISAAEARAGGWTSPDDGYAEPPRPIDVELAHADETIRTCAIDDLTGLEHPAMQAACQAYFAAAAAALESDPRASRLNVVSPKGQRILHSAWAGAKFDYSCGAMGVMNGNPTDAEKAAISAADDAGRVAAKNEIEAADAAATAE